MTENANENLETEVKPFTEGDHEIAYRTDSNPSVASGDATRPAVVAPGHGTGRRKQAIARVRLIPGTGEWKINGRTLDEYFPNKVHQQIVSEPFATTGMEGNYDVVARIVGGGVTGQAGALRLGVARALNAIDAGTEEGRHADPRRPRQGTQEGWSQEGPQGSAVLEALIWDQLEQ